MKKLIDFENTEAGDPLTGISIPALTRVTLARYAGASNDYNALHLDDKVAQAAGKNSVFAPSTLVMGFVGRMIEHSLEGSSVRRFGLRVLRLLWPGDVLTCRGAVVDVRKEGKDCVVDMDVWCDNQRGETVAKGRTVAVVPKNAEKGLTKAAGSQGLVYRLAIPAAAGEIGKAKGGSKKNTPAKTAGQK